MYKVEELSKKWAPVLDADNMPKIRDPYRRAITAVLLENQEKSCLENRTDGMLVEEINNKVDGGVTYSGNPNLKGYDPVLIAMIRRLAPNLMAFDVCGVQPMNAPVGLIFAMKSRYTSQGDAEALFNEADTSFSGQGTHTSPLDPLSGALDTGRGFDAGVGEQLGGPAGAPTEPPIAQMAFSIDRISVTAKTRALKAEFTTELQQDLKAIHGLDAESELANILSTEINAEINREIIRTIYMCAVPGAQFNTSVPGEFDLDVDANGRWLVEKFKGLMYQVERDANEIAKQTRRGKGNVLITSSDVASALSMAGLLDIGENLKDNLNVDDTGNTFVGRLNGRLDVYIDPYYATSNDNFYVVGYKGKNAYDAGIFYCPYVPLQLVKALDPATFQPKIGFKTRYGLVANPFSNIAGQSDGTLVSNSNIYYRKVKVVHLM
jgi:hypothetical protein